MNMQKGAVNSLSAGNSGEINSRLHAKDILAKSYSNNSSQPITTLTRQKSPFCGIDMPFHKSYLYNRF